MSIAENILKKIQQLHLVPLSKDRVKRRKYLLILCVLMLLGLGVFIVSFFISDAGGVIEFVELDTLYTIFIWIVAIFGLSFLIYRDSRNIGRLYRYSMMQVIVGVLSIMIFGGVMLHLFGGDIIAQNFLIKHTQYETVMSTYRTWNKPEEGRLIGEVKKTSREKIIIEDMAGKVWNIQFSPDMLNHKSKHFRKILEEGSTVKILGTAQSNGVFLAQDIKLLFE